MVLVVAAGGYFLFFGQGYNGQEQVVEEEGIIETSDMIGDEDNVVQEDVISGEAQVEISNFAFSPVAITVKAGTTVTWTNNDSVEHTATADNGSFDTGLLGSGESGSVTFDTPGTYTYYCAPHPYMTGTIIVE